MNVTAYVTYVHVYAYGYGYVCVHTSIYRANANDQSIILLRIAPVFIAGYSLFSTCFPSHWSCCTLDFRSMIIAQWPNRFTGSPSFASMASLSRPRRSNSYQMVARELTQLLKMVPASLCRSRNHWHNNGGEKRKPIIYSMYMIMIDVVIYMYWYLCWYVFKSEHESNYIKLQL